MRSNPAALCRRAWQSFAATAVLALLLFCTPIFAQSSGSIAGTVTGPTGAAISGAEVTITNEDTLSVVKVVTNASGAYDSGPLLAGEYTIKIVASGFRTTQITLSVGMNAHVIPGNVRLELGVEVNRRHPESQGIFNAKQIEGLPAARNFLDLAQWQPGAQVEDGEVLDPTKDGFSTLSVAGTAGRSLRIDSDGIDLTDETVGSTRQNLAPASIQEFRVSEANLSSPLTSAGAVSIVTKSGTDDLHGNLFGHFGEKRAGGANFPGGLDLPAQHELFGGDLGGPLIKDRLYFFLAGERSQQNLVAPVVFSAPFNALSGGYNSPFRETELDGRLDYQFSSGAKFFYKFTYDNSNLVSSFNGDNYQPFQNRNNTPAHTLGFDFTTGAYAHSLRFGYSKFANSITDAVAGSGVYDPAGAAVSLMFQGGSGFASGINYLAPQRTIQENKEFRYDGRRLWGAHSLRYGFDFNLIQDAVLADLYGSAPQVLADTGSASSAYVDRTCGDVALCVGNPLNYPVDGLTIASPFGCFSEHSAFGFPCGGLTDHRIQFYAGDTWNSRPSLTLTYGVSYVRDNGRTNSDLAPIPCSATGFLTCSGNLLDQFGASNLSGQIRQPNENFAPQFGLAWSPGDGSTVFRAGAGLYYDPAAFNNILFDRVSRLATGQFNGQAPDPCPTGVLLMPDGSRVTSVDGLDIASQICGQAIGPTLSAIGDLQAQYQATAAALGASGPNPYFLGQMLQSFGTIAPDYRTPRTVQMNIGLEHEFRQNTVLSIDYVRNVGTHYLLGYDTNHVGDSRFLNVNAALNAINATVTPAGCGPVTSAGANSQGAIDCYIAATPGASIADFARNGLDSGGQYLSGLPAEVLGLTPDTGAAFAGINPLVGRNLMFISAGNSRYSALQVTLRSELNHPFQHVKALDFRLGYAHARFDSNVPGGSSLSDPAFLPVAANFTQPNAGWGPGAADRTHQISFSTVFQFFFMGRLAFIGHFDSPLAETLFLPASGGTPGEIFRTDVDGDGAFGGNSQTGNSAYGDILPGTNIGAFGRTVTDSNLSSTISTYNTTQADKLTPSGLALISSDLFRGNQLAALGALTPTIPSPPANNVGLAWLRNVDVTYSFPFKIGERISIAPSFSAFNVLNLANFDALNNALTGVLNGAAGSANGTSIANRAGTRIGPGSGLFTLGAPRQLEFGLKISF